MQKLEKILGLIIIISLILKFFLVPYSGVLLTIVVSTLTLIYYPFGFAFFNGIRFRKILKKESYNGISAMRIIGSVGIGIALSILCIGILFKLQSWTGYNTNLKVGLFLSLIAFIIVLYKQLKIKDIFYKRILTRITIIGVLGLVLFFLP